MKVLCHTKLKKTLNFFAGNDPPEILPTDPQNMTVQLGEAVSIICRVKSDTPTTIKVSARSKWRFIYQVLSVDAN